MNDSQILERITALVRDELDNDAVVLTPSTKAHDVENWDSLAHVRIMVAVENEFSVRFDTNEITVLSNVADLISLVKKYAS